MTVGIIGGIGPLSTVYFMDMLVRMTDASTDQEHINSIVFNHATIPDRTKYILGLSEENPLTEMLDDAKKLENIGASFIAIPCNTAHYFFKSIQEAISIPMLNIVEEAVKHAKDRDVKRLGILATDGTIASRTYQTFCEDMGIECVVPDKESQRSIMKIIYDGVKAGKGVDMSEFMSIADGMRERGCEALICGCTELSILYKDFRLDREIFIDSLEVLARRTIEMCGKRVKEEYCDKSRSAV